MICFIFITLTYSNKFHHKLATVINFYGDNDQERDEESNQNSYQYSYQYGNQKKRLQALQSTLALELARSINGISGSITSEPHETDKRADTAKEMAALLSAARSTMLDDSAPDLLVSSDVYRSIKAASAAAIMALLRYLKQIGGTITSEFAQAWFVASMPSGLSKAT